MIHVALLEWVWLDGLNSLLFRTFICIMSILLALEAFDPAEIFLDFMLALAVEVLVIVAVVLVVAMVTSTMVLVTTIVVMAKILVTIPTMIVSMLLKTGAATMIIEVVLLLC